MSPKGRAPKGSGPAARWGGHWLDAAYARRTYRGETFSLGFGDVDVVRNLPVDAMERPALRVTFPSGDSVVGAAETLTFSVDYDAGYPEALRTGGALLVQPPAASARFAVLFVGATGDETLVQREAWARTLLPQGGISLIAETPYYGSRRAPAQRAYHLNTVADLGRLFRAQVTEVLLFNRHLRERFGLPVIAVGTSRGAQAALVAALLAGDQGPDATVCFLAPHDAAPVYLDGALARTVDWSALSDEAGGAKAARERLRDFLEAGRMDAIAARGRMGPLSFIDAQNDGFVPPEASAYFQSRFPDATFFSVKGGHVSAFARGHTTMLRAVRQMASRLVK